MMSKRALWIAAGVALAALPAAAYEYGGAYAVYVGPSLAYGAMGSAHNLTEEQWIGCQVWASYSGTYGFCSAKSANGTFLGCNTNNSALIGVMQSLTSDSYLTFMVDSSGTCTYVSVLTYSFNAPKR